jgi:hypothetical protein
MGIILSFAVGGPKIIRLREERLWSFAPRSSAARRLFCAIELSPGRRGG